MTSTRAFLRTSQKRNLSHVYEIIKKDKVRLITASILPYDSMSSVESRAIRELNSWIEAKSRELSVLYCDTNRAVADRGDPNRLSDSPDGIHPRVEGHRRMGLALSKVIEEDLSSGT